MTANQKIPGSYLGVLTSRIMALTIFSHVPIHRNQNFRIANARRRLYLVGENKSKLLGLKPIIPVALPNIVVKVTAKLKKLSSGKSVMGQVKPGGSVNTNH